MQEPPRQTAQELFLRVAGEALGGGCRAPSGGQEPGQGEDLGEEEVEGEGREEQGHHHAHELIFEVHHNTPHW